MTGDSSGNLSGFLDSNANGPVVTNASYTATCSIRADGRGVLTDTYGNHGYLYLISPMAFVEVQGSTPRQPMADQNLLFRNIR